MSETPTCATCRYFDRTGSGYGWCRRYAPRSYVGIEHRDEAAASYFPLVAEDDWCGEWRATEAAEQQAEEARVQRQQRLDEWKWERQDEMRRQDIAAKTEMAERLSAFGASLPPEKQAAFLDILPKLFGGGS